MSQSSPCKLEQKASASKPRKRKHIQIEDDNDAKAESQLSWSAPLLTCGVERNEPYDTYRDLINCLKSMVDLRIKRTRDEVAEDPYRESILELENESTRLHHHLVRVFTAQLQDVKVFYDKCTCPVKPLDIPWPAIDHEVSLTGISEVYDQKRQVMIDHLALLCRCPAHRFGIQPLERLRRSQKILWNVLFPSTFDLKSYGYSKPCGGNILLMFRFLFCLSILACGDCKREGDLLTERVGRDRYGYEVLEVINGGRWLIIGRFPRKKNDFEYVKVIRHWRSNGKCFYGIYDPEGTTKKDTYYRDLIWGEAENSLDRNF
jgi:hypothetical protein